jgi:methyl-accepting chemotaxis protein
MSSLNRKYLLPAVTISVVVCALLGAVMAWHARSDIERSLDAKADAVADFVTKFSADYFAIFDFTDFENFHKAVMTDPDVGFFVITNTNREPMSDIMAEPADAGRFIVKEREIRDEFDQLQGYLKIGYNRDSLDRSLRENVIIVGIGVFVASGLLAAVITLLTRFIITKPLDKTVEMLRDIAEGEGDLTRRLNVTSRDEFGELAKWFNTFVGNIHKIISTVRESIEHVSSSSHELAMSSEELTRGAREQSDQTERVAGSMNAMSQTIIDVARNAGEAADASSEAAQVATRGREVVETAVQGMLRIADTVRESSETIGRLGESSSEIGNIIQVIEDIADQTNLLALNAAIEAARAGEAGRGFAVVADEVRKLAERTGKATKEIAIMIEKIQADTERSVVSMESGSQEVQSGVKLAEEAMDALDQIVSSSTRGKDMVHLIAVASEEQSAAAEEVSGNMESILNISHGSTASTAQIKQTAEQLEKLSSDLQNMIGWFKV